MVNGVGGVAEEPWQPILIVGRKARVTGDRERMQPTPDEYKLKNRPAGDEPREGGAARGDETESLALVFASSTSQAAKA